jgi:hypothetical protein
MVATHQDPRSYETAAARVPARPITSWDETKSSFKTTELLVLLAAVGGVLVAARMDDGLDARWAWLLVSALAIGYMLSRGLAKAGSGHRTDDSGS